MQRVNVQMRGSGRDTHAETGQNILAQDFTGVDRGGWLLSLATMVVLQNRRQPLFYVVPAALPIVSISVFASGESHCAGPAIVPISQPSLPISTVVGRPLPFKACRMSALLSE